MKRQFLFVLLISALVAPGLPVAQDEFPPEPNPEEEPEKKKGSLLPRPEEDVKTALWVSKLGAARPEALTTRDGVLLHLVMSPDGERFYYFREVAKSDGKDGKPADESFVLFTVGPDGKQHEAFVRGLAVLAVGLRHFAEVVEALAVR